MTIPRTEIFNYFAFRPPYVFVDSVEYAEPGRYAIGLRYFPEDEWFFPIHFEDDPMVPGNLIAEAMGQVLGLCIQCMDEYRGKKAFLVATDKMRLFNSVRPGDTLRTKAIVTSFRRGLLIGHCESFVGDTKIASSGITLLFEGQPVITPK